MFPHRSLPLARAGAVEALLPFALSQVGYPSATASFAVACSGLNLSFAVIPATAVLRHLRRKPRIRKGDTGEP